MNCDVNNSPGKLQISSDQVVGFFISHPQATVNIENSQVFDFTAEDLQDLGEIGRGNFGCVNKMVHIKSNTVMAVKVS